MPHGIPLAGRFDLDDLRAHVAEQLTAEGAGDQCAEFEDAQVAERAGGARVGVVHGGAVVRRRPGRVKQIESAPMESTRVEIVEVGPRDGLQSEAQVLSTELKVEFVRRLVAAGLRRIEVASFVNPKRVPQIADAEAVLSMLGPDPAGGRYIGLVLNRKGFDRAHAAG